jgi:uncharacterized membrane protein YeaQ/YmgE (transglycosylase-associated protein family)
MVPDVVEDVPERRRIMEFAIDLGLGGWALVVVGALAFGIIAQYLGEAATAYDWLGTAIAAAIGALVASESIVAFQTTGPVWDGLALVPAIAGGLIVGIVVELATRAMTGGSFSGRPMSA